MKQAYIVGRTAGLVGGTLLCLLLSSCADPFAEVHVEKEVTSPDGKAVASCYVVAGGGAAGYVATRVKLRRKNEAFESDDNYIFESRHGSDLKLNWKNNHHLLVSYSADADTYRQLTIKGDTKVSYVVFNTKTTKTTSRP